MKLNRLIVVGIASLIATILPVAGYASTMFASPHTIAQAQSVALYSGTFVAAEQPTSGAARIVTEGGHRYLELDSAFTTSSQGPDLHVLLDTTATPPQSYQTLGSPINLGRIHSPNGMQRYPIPDSVNLSNFRSVVIWCRMANATFGYAPLRPSTSASIR